MLLSKCVVGDSKNLKFIKEQEVYLVFWVGFIKSGLFRSLGIKIHLSKMPLLSPLFLKVLTSQHKR